MAAGLPRGHAPAQRAAPSPTTASSRCRCCGRPTRPGRCSRSGWRCSAGSAPPPPGSGSGGGRAARRPGPAVAVGLAAAVVAVAAWPLVTGRALERQLAFDVPGYWRRPAPRSTVARANTRALVLPGQLFACYRGGRRSTRPAGAHRPSRRHALDRALRRPALGRAAVGGRRPRLAGPGAARGSCPRCSTCWASATCSWPPTATARAQARSARSKPLRRSGGRACAHARRTTGRRRPGRGPDRGGPHAARAAARARPDRRALRVAPRAGAARSSTAARRG